MPLPARGEDSLQGVRAIARPLPLRQHLPRVAASMLVKCRAPGMALSWSSVATGDCSGLLGSRQGLFGKDLPDWGLLPDPEARPPDSPSLARGALPWEKGNPIKEI